jgi:hypothetical protein
MSNMPDHPFSPVQGEFRTITIDSKSIAGNMLGDPTTREVQVYLCKGWENGNLPIFVDLVGFTGSGRAHSNWKPFQESLPQRLDRLVAAGEMGPVALALPDCFTSLGGNQYINSKAMGNWADFLIEEMIPALESELPVIQGAKGRAVFGKSSGGYGAMVHGMLHPEHWGAIACHSGDMGFDRLFAGDFPKALMALEKRGGVDGFLKHTSDSTKMKGEDFHTLMILAMAATYDADENSPKGIRLPVDPRTCVLDKERWANWLKWDPVVMLERSDVQDNLKELKGLFIDCGQQDQYNIQFGTRQLCDRLSELNIEHRYEEFEDTHSSIDYRMDISLPFLYRALMS